MTQDNCVRKGEKDDRDACNGMTVLDIEHMQLDRAAETRGPWRPSFDGVLAIGSVDTASCAVLGRIATAHETDGVDSDGRHWSTSGGAYARAS